MYEVICAMLTLKLLLPFFCKVVIGGRNKYLINGVNANNTRVQDLFCSVGLNVNNPHFLIMQVSLVSAAVCMVVVLSLWQYFESCDVSYILGEDHQSSQHEATWGKTNKHTLSYISPSFFSLLRSLGDHLFPLQILAMIEEAAGTRMYECKKLSAQKTIEKKEAKLKEIQTVC